MRECNNCGAPVDPEFYRVFADNDGNLRACTECGNAQGNDYTVPGGDRRDPDENEELGGTAPEEIVNNRNL